MLYSKVSNIYLSYPTIKNLDNLALSSIPICIQASFSPCHLNFVVLTVNVLCHYVSYHFFSWNDSSWTCVDSCLSTHVYFGLPVSANNCCSCNQPLESSRSCWWSVFHGIGKGKIILIPGNPLTDLICMHVHPVYPALGNWPKCSHLLIFLQKTS